MISSSSFPKIFMQQFVTKSVTTWCAASSPASMTFIYREMEFWQCSFEIHENPHHHGEHIISLRAYDSSLGAEGVVGAAELGIKWLNDECATTPPLWHSDDDRLESGKRGKSAPLWPCFKWYVTYAVDGTSLLQYNLCSTCITSISAAMLKMSEEYCHFWTVYYESCKYCLIYDT